MSTRILLVEDNPDDEALTLRALRSVSVPIEVEVARDGAAALTALGLDGESRPSDRLPSLVLLDIKIPKVSGLEVLSAIRQSSETRNLPVVMLSSSDEPSDVKSASNFQASRYVRKPVDYDEFMSDMSAVIREFLIPAC